MEPKRVLLEQHTEKLTLPETSVQIAVVVPVCDRHDDLRELYFRHSQELTATGYAFEFIFVLDGSDDDALQRLKELKGEYHGIHVITLNRRFGDATALAVGFEKASAPIILTLAPIFQVEPSEVRKVVDKLVKEDLDLVISWRNPRVDARFNRAQSWVFRRLIRVLTGTRYHDILCGVRAMKRKVAKELTLYGDLHHFLPLLAYQRGFKIAEVPVRQSRYDAGRRVYRPGVYLKKLLDLLTLFFLFGFTRKPLRFFGAAGSGLFASGTIITGYLGLYRLMGLGGIAERPLLILGVLLIVLGIQLFSIGLLGELVIFTHARDAKEYHIDEILE